jgi:hypothetical protein
VDREPEMSLYRKLAHVKNYYNRSNNDLCFAGASEGMPLFEIFIGPVKIVYANTDDINREKNLIQLRILGLPRSHPKQEFDAESALPAIYIPRFG